MPKFHIRLAGDDLVFCAGHFLTFDDTRCERLHGHSYTVVAELWGPLEPNQYVIDFLTASDALKAIIAELDHRVLLPAEHPAIHISCGRGEIQVTFANRRWVLPEGDCLLLPIAATTTELLAQYVGERLLAAVGALGGPLPERVRVEIGEGTGALGRLRIAVMYPSRSARGIQSSYCTPSRSARGIQSSYCTPLRSARGSAKPAIASRGA